MIGTEATVGSRAYDDTFAAAPHLQVTSVACPEFVDYVERGVTTGPELLRAAQGYLEPLKDAGVDTLVLGCTHYPLLTAVISYVMGDSVNLVSSAEETARDVYRALMDNNLERDVSLTPHHEFLATGDPESFEVLARRFLGPEVTHVEFHQTGVIQLPGRTD